MSFRHFKKTKGGDRNTLIAKWLTLGITFFKWPWMWCRMEYFETNLCCICHSSYEFLHCASWGDLSYKQLAETCHKLCRGFCPRGMQDVTGGDLLWQRRNCKSETWKVSAHFNIVQSRVCITLGLLAPNVTWHLWGLSVVWTCLICPFKWSGLEWEKIVFR